MPRYLVVVEKGENSYGAYAPDVPGCVAAGDSVEETLQLIKEALEFHLEGIVEDGDNVPEAAHVEAHFVDVSLPAKLTAAS
ncbi:MAG TPA: type II toxin-antitoxin system HicB family antitoxin [Chloroflexia bacterium]|jgi:predicted RNase H-like HicB family nuclease